MEKDPASATTTTAKSEHDPEAEDIRKGLQSLRWE
jgi:hypothetical protein